MKNILWMILGVLASTGPVLADYQKGSQSLAFSLGSAGYSQDFKPNNGNNDLTKGGAAGGIQYLYFIKSGPTLAVGPDILWTDIKDQQPSSFLANSNSDAAVHTTIYQVILKLAYPSGHVRPYLLGGAGASRSSLQSDISGATESQKTFDSVKFGAAWSWGIGFDFFFGERFFLGTELRQTRLSGSLHEPTPFGQSLGIDSIRDPDALNMLMLKAGYKFGAK